MKHRVLFVEFSDLDIAKKFGIWLYFAQIYNLNPKHLEKNYKWLQTTQKLEINSNSKSYNRQIYLLKQGEGKNKITPSETPLVK